jgi:uncharacterized protein (TIGR02594 family)
MNPLLKLLDAIRIWRVPKAEEPPKSTKPVWITKAQSYIGFHEKPNNRGIEEFIRLGKCGAIGDPWCAIFVNANLESTGFPGTRSALARSFERSSNFYRLEGPAFGAITTMWRGSVVSGLGHVFFYLGENDKGIVALGGNQSDQVCIQYEPRSRVVGYWWPKNAPHPVMGKVFVPYGDAEEGSET